MMSVLLVFLLSLAGLLFYARIDKTVPSISVKTEETGSQELSEETLTPTPSYSKEIVEIEDDLKMIEADIYKVKEDSRLNPPSFIFTLGLDQ